MDVEEVSTTSLHHDSMGGANNSNNYNEPLPATSSSSEAPSVLPPNPHVLSPLISDEAYSIIIIVSLVVLTITSLFGFVVNILNIIVYKKHGLKESIILGFFALSISDLVVVFCLLCACAASAAHTLYPTSLIDITGIQSITTGNLREMAFFYSNILTAMLSIERCCCVIFPFHVKLIFTPQRSRAIIIGLLVFVIIGFAPVFASNHIRWIPIPGLNGTRFLTVWYPPYRIAIYDFSFIFMGIPIPTVALLVVIINTFVMIYGLRASSKFRQATTSASQSAEDSKSSNKTGGVTSRDSRLVKAMVFLGTILVLCNLPYVAFLYIMYFEPELDFGRAYQNTFLAVYGWCYILSSVNASANVLVYYKNSSRYRQIFDQTFGGWGCCGGTGTNDDTPKQKNRKNNADVSATVTTT